MKPIKTIFITILFLSQFILAQSSITGKVIAVKDGVTIDVLVGSSNSKKFHKASYRHAKSITAKNAVGFETKDEAVKARYEACKVCKP